MDISSEQWKYFVDVGVWPRKVSFSPNEWIKNFSGDEIPLALRLLEGFTYFSEDMVKQLFRSSFVQISKSLVSSKDDLVKARLEWSRFLDSVYIVRVTGEQPSDADSGYLFARYSRDVLGIPEPQIVSPEQAIAALAAKPDGNIVFVDDFVGSGNQFIDTWNRKYLIGQHRASFNDLANYAKDKVGFFYCPVVCTEKGRFNIGQNCPSVSLVTAHYYGAFHSALNADSFIWRDDMKGEGPDFVEKASLRAGIPFLDGAEGCWMGFHKLGLALGFSHGWPDATLPLFDFDKNDWRPLLRKGVL